MKQDISKLMKKNRVNGLIVLGDVEGNADMKYLIGGAPLHSPMVVIKQSGKKYLIHRSLDESEARRIRGFEHINFHAKYSFSKHLKQARGNHQKARVALWKQVFADLKIKGNVSFFGKTQIHGHYELLKALNRDRRWEIIDSIEKSILLEARETKDQNEIKIIKDVGKRCEIIFRQVKKYLKAKKVRNNYVYKTTHQILTIGDIKELIKELMFKLDLVDTQGFIFAQGKQAADIHDQGNPKTKIKVGQPIVFDFYPQDKKTGYYFDITRTWCIKQASPEVRKIYKNVLEVQNKSIQALKVKTLASKYQKLACRLFHQHGHPTIEHDPNTKEGYVHSLGHGIGLDVHEHPFMYSTDKSKILPGSVFTIEPGLYFPSKKIGMRIEDVIYVHKDGRMENLTKMDKELVIK